MNSVNPASRRIVNPYHSPAPFPINRSRHRGFTLLEMSLVIVVIALVIGGFIASKSMIRQARLRGVQSEAQHYIQAIQDFKDKYGYLPGDMPNATTFWGTDPAPSGGSCPSVNYYATPHITVCNGNGDGVIGGSASGAWYESYRAWQELSNAGFISGTFNGISGTGGSATTNSVIGVNVPASSLTGAGYTIIYYFLPTGFSNNIGPIMSHALVLGAVVANSYTYGGAMTPAEALAIDTKIDDGLPEYGKVMAFLSALMPNCTNSDNVSASRYDTTQNGYKCGLLFLTGF